MPETRNCFMANGRRAAEFTALIASVVLLAICLISAYRPYAREDVVGDYALRYPDGTSERLTLSQNGAFIQSHGGERHEGRWSYERHLVRSAVLLDEQMIFKDSV